MVMFNLESLAKLVDPAPVTVEHSACLLARHHASPCRRCMEACPDQALSFADGKVHLDQDRCSRCGCCAGACPTAAITVRGIDSRALAASARISCQKAPPGPAVVPCLGYLDVDSMVELGLRHGSVLLSSGECAACPWQQGGASARTAAATASAALHALGRRNSSVKVRDVPKEQGGAEPVMSRRDLLSLFGLQTAQVARQFAPERPVNPANLPARVPRRRREWLQRLDPKALVCDRTMPPGPWRRRSTGSECIGCGICAAFCPTGSLRVDPPAGDRLETAAAPDHWRLLQQPAACINCGTCDEVCPAGALAEEPITAAEMGDASVRELTRWTVKLCKSCSGSFKARGGEEQCPQCRSMAQLLSGPGTGSHRVKTDRHE